MEKKPTKNRKQKPLLVELTYRPAVDDPTTQQMVDRAFDVLFEEVLKRRQSKVEEYPQKRIDIL